MPTDLALDNDLTAIAPPWRFAAAARHASASNNTLATGTRLAEFEIQGVIAEGGFGIVYAAYDHSLRRRVALKEYMPSVLATRIGTHTVAPKSRQHSETFDTGLSSFINEAQLLARFDHPSLVKVYRFWEANGTAYMVMPLYEGLTLKETLRSTSEPPTEAWLKTLIAQMLEALRVLHAEHCYHRDIAPDNILMLRDGRALLLDFGAARRVIEDMTQALTVILKPGYAPIEQYAESSSLRQGAWTDLYALAAVVHFAITGKPPPPAVARSVTDPYQPLAERAKHRYSAAFLQTIDRALQVLPAARPQSVAEFARLLGVELGRDATHAESVAHSAVAKPHRAKRTSRSRIAFVAGGAAFALMAGGWYVLEHESRVPPQLEPRVEPSPPVLEPSPPVMKPSPAPDALPVPVIAPRPEEPLVLKQTPQPTEPTPPPKTETPSPPPQGVRPPSPVASASGNKGKGKPAPPREAGNHQRPAPPRDPPSTRGDPEPDVSNQRSRPNEQVTSVRCRDILVRESLGEVLTPDMKGNCP